MPRFRQKGSSGGRVQAAEFSGYRNIAGSGTPRLVRHALDPDAKDPAYSPSTRGGKRPVTQVKPTSLNDAHALALEMARKEGVQPAQSIALGRRTVVPLKVESAFIRFQAQLRGAAWEKPGGDVRDTRHLRWPHECHPQWSRDARVAG